MANEQNLKPFKKGYDARRNLKGVPRDVLKARKLIRSIGAELINLPNSEEKVTRIYAMLRLMFSSKAPKDKETLMKALWPGLLRDEINLTVDYSKLTDDQLDRIIAGEDVVTVLTAHRAGKS